MKDKLRHSARLCLQNGRRLLEDALSLELCEPPTTALFLSLVAEEEFAKAFLLALVLHDVIPWDLRLLRAGRDHKCKQLLCLVMEYLSPDTDEFIERCNAVVLRHEEVIIPQKVLDAIHILRHEKLGRWVEKSWVWAENPEYDPEAASIAEGRLDKFKQDTLYVRLGRDGSTASIPSGATYESLYAERERARRIATVAEAVLDGEKYPGIDYDEVEKVFRALFASLPLDRS